ncbi:hypothetical protein BJ742DRAFT_117324 [Cladochytrium replicatum]|nr:hypothetical protein BJ742DRAFT_117324 [Cladochytrium replicatum]
MFRLSQQETQRNIELTEQVNLLHRAMQLNELRTFLHDRDLQIGRLNDLEALQQVAIHHIQQTIEVEREGYLEATQMDAQFKKALTKLLREEEAMMSGLYEAKAGKKKVEELLKQALDTSKRSLVDLEALKQEVAQKLKNYEDARKKLRDKQAMVFDQMGGTTMQLLQLLVQVLTTLKIKVRKRKEWIERRLRAEEKRNQALNWDEDLEIDKLVPEWDNPNFAWPRVCEMALETYVPPAKLPPFMTAMLTASGWVELGIQCQRTVETVRMMSRPFGNGSYRLAFYALGSSGMRYTVKQFKQPAENDAADWDYGLKTGLLHAFSWTAAQFFSAACRKCHPPLHIDISYVPSYVARNLSDNNRVYMVEPLLPDFQKWTNNDTFISESVEGDIMAAFTHFTLHYSEGNFMITDLQGFCERGVPNAGGSATLHPNSPPPLSRTSIASSRTSRSSRTRGSSQDRGDRQDDGNPFKDRFIFTLTDPAMHLLAFRGESGMLDELESDQAGDLGPDGRDAFLSVHQCGDVCRALKLPHNTPFQLQRGGTVRYPDNASELPYAK